MDKVKIVLRIILIVLLSNISNSFAGGMTDQIKARHIESLQDYQIQNVSGTLSASRQKKVDAQCFRYQNKLYENSFCAEQKYIKSGNYVIKLDFDNHTNVARPPYSPQIPNVKPFQRDTTKRDNYLESMSEKLLLLYLGNDYKNKFVEAELVNISKYAVVIEVQIAGKSEFTEILDYSNLRAVYHIGYLGSAPEEVLP